MRRSTIFVLTSLLCLTHPLWAEPQPGQEPQKPEGETLILRDVQGGFAGFTGIQITIHANGKWSTAEVLAEKVTPLKSGTLPAQTRTRFNNLLKDQLEEELPAEINGPAKVNPHLVELQYGDLKTTLILGAGEALPVPTKENTPQNRVLRILQAASNVIKLAERAPAEP